MFHNHPPNCLPHLKSDEQLLSLVQESANNRIKRQNLLIHQLNEMRYHLTIQSNNRIEATFYLDDANERLNQMKETPIARLLDIAIENNKLRSINHHLLESIQQVKECASFQVD